MNIIDRVHFLWQRTNRPLPAGSAYIRHTRWVRGQRWSLPACG